MFKINITVRQYLQAEPIRLTESVNKIITFKNFSRKTLDGVPFTKQLASLTPATLMEMANYIFLCALQTFQGSIFKIFLQVTASREKKVDHEALNGDKL